MILTDSLSMNQSLLRTLTEGTPARPAPDHVRRPREAARPRWCCLMTGALAAGTAARGLWGGAGEGRGKREGERGEKEMGREKEEKS